MNAPPMAFSGVCYQWGANTSLLMRSVPIGQGGWGSLSENLKGGARVIYMIGVSTFIAPFGMTYHLLQAGLQKGHSLIAADPAQSNHLSQRAWRHLRCSEKDLFSVCRGCLVSAVLLPCLGIVTVSGLIIGVKENNLMITVLGGLAGFSVYSLISGPHSPYESPSLVYPAWDNLTAVSLSLNNNHLDKFDLFLLAFLVADVVSGILVAIFRRYG